MNKIKESFNIHNIVFIVASILLAFYGLYYNSVDNLWIMIVTVPFIAYQSFYVKHLSFDINFCFLMETFFVKAIMDQQIGKADIVPTTMALPMLMYLLGKLIIVGKEPQKKRVIISLGALTIGISILAGINCFLTKKSSIGAMGYYSVAFKGETLYTNKATFLFNFVFLGALVIACLFFVLNRTFLKFEKTRRIRQILDLLLGLFAILLGIVKYVKTENFAALKEGVQLITTKHWGNFGLDLTHNNSTYNMWLEYGRDYGILVFITLFIFFILTIKDAVKLVLNKNVDIFIKSWIIVLFAAVNVYYFVDATAYVYPCIWYVGLIVCGMLSVVANWEQSQS